ncbi:FUSC family protein [Pedosphaera parvula]|uniref:Membrane protein-like protein n=1 Tax=Pedosphaera parvula (strain Ellin514) TaxID=320771 RepID=B9XKL2_PEDPL|nr:aromatic acid exporter family protein [Pedosphaera parvula]EEF59682.1 membrane protein-like protein [Pedosphaera parvula Ellin514]
MRSGHLHALIFSTKAALSAVLAVYVCAPFHLHAIGWAAVSAVIVTQPKLHPSLRASLLRFVANLIGALVGAALFTLLGHNVLAMAIGIILTGIACHFTRINEVNRSAFAAVVIVVLSGGAVPGSGPLDRVFAVMVGCVAALLVGYIFDKSSRRLFPLSREPDLPEKTVSGPSNHAD